MDEIACICGAHAFGRRLIYGVNHRGLLVDVRLCSTCGVGRTVPVPPVEELESAAYQSHDDFRVRRVAFERTRAHYGTLLRLVRERLATPRPRILDVGCSVGALLAEARALGFEGVGLEINEHAARYAREELGLDIRASSIEDTVRAGDGYDVVTLTQTVEHLRRPQCVVSSLAPLLREGGLIVVEVPNHRSFYAELMGKFWPAWSPAQHLWHFSHESIGALATYGSGIALTSVMRRRCLDYHFVPTALRPLSDAPGSLFDRGDNLTAIFERA